MEQLKSDQHCILFTSKKNMQLEGFESFQREHLTRSLRSSAEICKFASKWVQLYSHAEEEEFDVKHGHNFYAENPDIHFVPQETLEYSNFVASFVEKSVGVISENAPKFSELEFLPVLVCMEENISQQLQDALKLRFRLLNVRANVPSFEFENSSGKRRKTTNPESGGNTFPPIKFFRFTETEGMEFGVAFILVCTQGCSDKWSEIFSGFFTAVTRATTKLIIVHNTEDANDDISTDGINTSIQERLEGIVREIETEESTAILVGTNYKFQFFQSLSDEDKLNEERPYISGMQYVTGPSGGNFIQIDKLKPEDAEETIEMLVKKGVTQVIIIGKEFPETSQNINFCVEMELLLSKSSFSGKLSIHNLARLLFPFETEKQIFRNFLRRTSQK